jgi:acyl-CoA dehydrogenase
MADLELFRRETRAWLEANCPAAMRMPILSEEDHCWGGRRRTFASTAQEQWFTRMVARGWTVPAWPREYAGGGLGAEEAAIVAQEMHALGCRPPLSSFGIWMLGPALLKFGTEAQKRTHLLPIARGEIRWCQGYSEPNAGSDLASLQTRAEDRGDHYIVNGQKIWTSYADKADWIFCLVRSESEAKKHTGISFVLFDMTSQGVTTRPILLISGKSPFCETFFDNVRVEKSNLVGAPGSGWEVAKYLLTHERAMISAIGDRAQPQRLGEQARALMGAAGGPLPDPILRAQIAEFEVDEAAFKMMLERFGALARAGESHPAYSSALKYYGAELNKRRHELLMSAGGSDALEWDSERSGQGAAARAWLRTKGNSIEGGTSEIQLNVIARRILDLPTA